MKETMKRSSIAVALLMGGVLFISFGPRAKSQEAVAPPVAAAFEVGRYQMIKLSANDVYLLDTKTGRVWYRYGTGAALWEEQSPAITKGK